MAASSSLWNPLRWRRLIAGAGIARRSLHEGPDTIEELLERHLVKNNSKNTDEEDELAVRRRLTSTRREALALYRDILRASRFFSWPDAHGVVWRDVLREKARWEFEEARFERDPEIVTRLLIGGREAVEKALEKLVESLETQKKRMAEADEDGRGGGRRQEQVDMPKTKTKLHDIHIQQTIHQLHLHMILSGLIGFSGACFYQSSSSKTRKMPWNRKDPHLRVRNPLEDIKFIASKRISTSLVRLRISKQKID
ncbi:hypothetical protein J5N97_023951 [Dioscorea zingiberensis]|uniref:Complex 1 LYR protein domain-containing protein n=1 Tax=Dioscorea zingiberensis TaxID=325984 RepID=A0A9D5C6J2_9LILI|nr:hypothetical protein J5N97_023951 [Dioscorea zingiberensis]